MNILAKTAAVVLAAAALCGLGVGTAAAATSDQVSSTTPICTDTINYLKAEADQTFAEIQALLQKIRDEQESDPAQAEADNITLRALNDQYDREVDALYGQVAKCNQTKPGIIGNMG